MNQTKFLSKNKYGFYEMKIDSDKMKLMGSP